VGHATAMAIQVTARPNNRLKLTVDPPSIK
jgi:hypothetical protein